MKTIEAFYSFPLWKNKKEPVDLLPMTEEGIAEVPEDITHGNYRIGLLDRAGNRFFVRYIGRADHGLQKRIHDHLSDFIEELIEKYPGSVFFSFNSEINELDAYHHECEDYHYFLPDLNDIHPAKPEYPDTACKICGI